MDLTDITLSAETSSKEDIAALLYKWCRVLVSIESGMMIVTVLFSSRDDDYSFFVSFVRVHCRSN
jgi:hypothetical protein